jgi:hypothetical protein
MDPRRLDGLTRALSTAGSRRRVLGALLAGVLRSLQLLATRTFRPLPWETSGSLGVTQAYPRGREVDNSHLRSRSRFRGLLKASRGTVSVR